VENTAPVASDDIATTNEDTMLSINVLANDTDVDNDILSVTYASANNGIVVVNSNGELEYTPNANFTGEDIIVYTINDGNGATDTASVGVSVNPVNDSPTISGLSFGSVVEDTTHTTTQGELIVSDIDSDSFSWSITNATGTYGTLSINNIGQWTYTLDNSLEATQLLNDNDKKVETFEVKVNDNSGTVNTIASQAINVIVYGSDEIITQQNTAPVASDDLFAHSGEESMVIDILRNDSDAENDNIVITKAEALYGTITFNADKTINYLVNEGFTGDIISYTITDGEFYDSAIVNVLLEGGEMHVNTHTQSNQEDPSITTLSDGTHVIAWQSNYQDGSSTSIHAQRFDTNSNKLGNEFQVNTYTSSDQQYPDTTALNDGGFVITWVSTGQDGSGYGIYAQRYDASGNVVGDEFRVNTYTSQNQEQSSTTALADGGFVVTWSGNGSSDGSGIYAQRFDEDGNSVGAEFRVNAYTSSTQSQPDVVALNNGGFVIAWQSNGQDEFGYGIYAQKFDDSGNKVGNEFNINSFVIGSQSNVDLLAYGNNDFVATWTSNGEIFCQVFDGDGVRLSTNSLYAPPVLVSGVNDQVTNEYTPYSYDVTSNFKDIISDIPLTYSASLENGADLPEWLSLDETTGVLTGTPISGDAGAINITVSATDFAGQSVTDIFSITINLIELTTIAEDSNDVASGVLTSIGESYSIDNQGVYGNLSIDQYGAWTYELDNTNELTDALSAVETVIDSFTVLVTDAQGVITEIVTVSIQGANDAPVITSSSTLFMPENGINVGSVLVVDVDSSNISYSITGGVDALLFSIDSSTGILVFNSAPDYELLNPIADDNIYNLIVSAIDDGGASVSQDITVTVENVDGVPVFLSSNAITIDENTALITTLSASDDENDQIAFTITGGLDQEDFVINDNVLALKNVSDYEVKNSYDLAITATEYLTQDGSYIALPNSTTQNIVVTVNDLDESLFISDDYPLSFTARTISAKKASTELYGSDYAVNPNETVIKLTLSADMANVVNPLISSISGAEISIMLDWTQFEAFTYTNSSSKAFESSHSLDSLSIWQTYTDQLTGALDKLVVASIDTLSTPPKTLVDNIDSTGLGVTDKPSVLELGSIYLKPIDSVESVDLIYSGIIITNEGADNFNQAAVDLTINTVMSAMIYTDDGLLLSNLDMKYFYNEVDTTISTPIDAGMIKIDDIVSFDTVKFSDSNAYQGDLNIIDLYGVLDLVGQEVNDAKTHAADADNNGVINIVDLYNVLDHIGQTPDIFDVIDEQGNRVTQLDANTMTEIENWIIVANGDVDMSGGFNETYLVSSDLV
jgi:VCBS repeat-containing protein